VPSIGTYDVSAKDKLAFKRAPSTQFARAVQFLSPVKHPITNSSSIMAGRRNNSEESFPTFENSILTAIHARWMNKL
jgi:hypothetical protein